MKITAVLVLKCSGGSVSDPVVLANATDVSHLGFFRRGFAKEFILFAGHEIAQSAPAQFDSLHFEEYVVHSYNRNGLCAVAFTDAHYPVRSAFSLLNKVLDEYQKNFGDSWRAMTIDSTQPWPYLDEALTKFQDHAEADELLTKIILVLDEYQKNFGDSWRAMTIESTQPWPYLDEALTKFQDPAEADKLLEIQRALDETKIILHKTVVALGEKLDNLVEKSSDISAVSQMLYKLAKKTNQWCAIL